jgi:clan AA aspartic protease
MVGRQGPVVPLILWDLGGREHTLTAVVDTGFNGWLTLPKATIVTLGLTWHDETRAILADGAEAVFATYHATVLWDGQPQAVFADELESDPVIGMRLLHGFRFTMETIDGGPVRIERL